jgi:hypothetical protein
MAEVHSAMRCDFHLGRKGAMSLAGSHDRMAAKGPGRRRPVKAAAGGVGRAQREP